MFSDRPQAFPRWTIISLLLFLSFLSGMLELDSSGEPYITQTVRQGTDVQGSASSSGEIALRAQMGQLDVGQSNTQSNVTNKTQAKGEWGVAKQVDEHTWTMQVADDERMATPQEILIALNNYRQKHGKGSLAWDTGLAAYAQERTNYFVSLKRLDAHAGFSDFVDKQDGFIKLGFGGLGENSSYGYRLAGVHLIEWVYAGDKPHDDNQLNSAWTHVGIGVNGTATNLIFGGDKF